MVRLFQQLLLPDLGLNKKFTETDAYESHASQIILALCSQGVMSRISLEYVE